MTQVTAKLSSLRIAPRKVRLVAHLIKGMEVRDAEVQLHAYVKRASDPILKLLKSAIANAKHNAKVSDTTLLYVRDVRVDEGRAFKRFMPRARGRAAGIKKRTSHTTIVLSTEKK